MSVHLLVRPVPNLDGEHSGLIQPNFAMKIVTPDAEKCRIGSSKFHKVKTFVEFPSEIFEPVKAIFSVVHEFSPSIQARISFSYMKITTHSKVSNWDVEMEVGVQ